MPKRTHGGGRKPLAEEETVTFSISVTKSFRDRLNRVPELTGLSRAAWIRKVMEDALVDEEAIANHVKVLTEFFGKKEDNLTSPSNVTTIKDMNDMDTQEH